MDLLLTIKSTAFQNDLKMFINNYFYLRKVANVSECVVIVNLLEFLY